MERQGLGGTDIDRSEKTRGRETWWSCQLKHPVPSVFPQCECVCVCLHHVFSTAVSLPALPVPRESVFTQRGFWAVAAGAALPPSPLGTNRRASGGWGGDVTLKNEACAFWDVDGWLNWNAESARPPTPSDGAKRLVPQCSHRGEKGEIIWANA